MILGALVDYYQRLLDDPESGVAQPGYSQGKISYAIVLDRNGQVVDVHDLRDTTGKKPFPAALEVPQPPKRASNIAPCFLWDKTSYVLGISSTSKRVRQEHTVFVTFHENALANTDDIGLRALLTFLEGWAPERWQEHSCFARHGDALLDTNVVFRLDGEQCYLHERPAAREAWSRLQTANTTSTRGVCLVTGCGDVLARLHPPIKGVSGAQSSGASIISFNLEAFTSYGKQQGENAPVSERAAFAYTTALNHLLRHGAHNRQRVQIGDTTVVFWANAADKAQVDGAEDVLAAFLGTQDTDAQTTEQFHRVLQQVRQARPLRELGLGLNDDTRIFVLGLAPNASRLSIRFWQTDTLATFARRLADHYDDLALEPAAWHTAPSPWLLALQSAPVYGDKGKAKPEDVPPLLAGELTRAILAGTRYPRSMLAEILMRFRADGQIKPLRVALCKAVLARDARLGYSSPNHGEPPVSLDLANTDPGYLLGRLFAALESTQLAALGRDVNATIRDRYYGAASSTPASIFPVLLRNAQNHLGKLRKTKPGLAVTLEREIGQIIDMLKPSFPRSLRVEAQGHFAIGYYHQTRARFDHSNVQDAQDSAPEGEPA